MKIGTIGRRRRRDRAPRRPLTAVLIAGLLGSGAAGCAPDETSFFDLHRHGEDGRDPSGRVAVYPLATGAWGSDIATLPSGSLETVSLDFAVDCVSALRVTQRILTQQGGGMSAQASDAMRQAEVLFHERAEAAAGRESTTTADLAVAMEKTTQVLVESPNEAAQQALTCLGALSENA